MNAIEDNLDLLLDRWTIQPLDRDLTGSILRRLAAEERSLDELLTQADEPVALGRDLSGPVLRAVRRRAIRRRLIASLAPLAAAAAITLAAFVGLQVRPPPAAPPPRIALTEAEELAVRNFELVRDYPVLVHWDTIRAMEQLEREESDRSAQDRS